MRGSSSITIFFLACFLCLEASHAQQIALRGGESELEQASGAGLTLSYAPYSLDVLAGSFMGRTEIGASLKGQFGKYKFVAGDQVVGLFSPIYGDQSRGFLARGASFTSQIGKKTRLMLFGGSTGQAIGSQLFQIVRQNQPIGSLQLEIEGNERLKLFLHSMFGSRQSIVGGFEYRPVKTLHLGAQGGMGSNSPFWAVTGDFRKPDTTLEGSYTSAQSEFHLVQAGTLYYQEPIHENLHVQHRFDGLLQADYRRNNFQFQAQNGTFNQYSAHVVFLTGKLLATGWSAGYNRAEGTMVVQGVTTPRNGAEVNFGLSRRAGPIRLSANQYRPILNQNGSTMQRMTLVMATEPLGRWMSLRQYATRTQNWSVNYGGDLHTNTLTLSVDYQTMYNIFQPGKMQFTQAAIVQGEAHLPHGVVAFVNTMVTPDGQTLYGWGVKGAFMGPMGSGRAGGLEVMSGDEAPQMPRYVVQGKVIDADTGEPLRDFPVQIGGEKIFTDEAGVCSLRLFSGRIVSGYPDVQIPYRGFTYEVVDGPKKVQPVKDRSGQEYVWKIRKVKSAQSAGTGGLVVVSSIRGPDTQTSPGAVAAAPAATGAAASETQGAGETSGAPGMKSPGARDKQR